MGVTVDNDQIAAVVREARRWQTMINLAKQFYRQQPKKHKNAPAAASAALRQLGIPYHDSDDSFHKLVVSLGREGAHESAARRKQLSLSLS